MKFTSSSMIASSAPVSLRAGKFCGTYSSEFAA